MSVLLFTTGGLFLLSLLLSRLHGCAGSSCPDQNHTTNPNCMLSPVIFDDRVPTELNINIHIISRSLKSPYKQFWAYVYLNQIPKQYFQFVNRKKLFLCTKMSRFISEHTEDSSGSSAVSSLKLMKSSGDRNNTKMHKHYSWTLLQSLQCKVKPKGLVCTDDFISTGHPLNGCNPSIPGL